MPRKNTRILTATETNDTATDTLASPGKDRRWRVMAFSASLAGEDGEAALTIVASTDDGGDVTLWSEQVVTGAPVGLAFANGIQAPPGHAITISLAAGGTDVVGSCNALLEMEE